MQQEAEPVGHWMHFNVKKKKKPLKVQLYLTLSLFIIDVFLIYLNVYKKQLSEFV